jgi:hypothetical protein
MDLEKTPTFVATDPFEKEKMSNPLQTINTIHLRSEPPQNNTDETVNLPEEQMDIDQDDCSQKDQEAIAGRDVNGEDTMLVDDHGGVMEKKKMTDMENLRKKDYHRHKKGKAKATNSDRGAPESEESIDVDPSSQKLMQQALQTAFTGNNPNPATSSNIHQSLETPSFFYLWNLCWQIIWESKNSFSKIKTRVLRERGEGETTQYS